MLTLQPDGAAAVEAAVWGARWVAESEMVCGSLLSRVLYQQLLTFLAPSDLTVDGTVDHDRGGNERQNSGCW